MRETNNPQYSQTPKTIYRVPRLTMYGGMAKLTAAGTGQSAEGQGQNANDPTRRD